MDKGIFEEKISIVALPASPSSQGLPSIFLLDGDPDLSQDPEGSLVDPVRLRFAENPQFKPLVWLHLPSLPTAPEAGVQSNR